jgi:hypothetical protein
LVRKFFPLDKNYLLEAAQLRSEERLLSNLVDEAKNRYELVHNPLGLNDSFSVMIGCYKPTNLKPLSAFYETLAGVYRFKFGETQLGFLWDGKDHAEKYEDDWSHVFGEWTAKLCERDQFVQAVLDLTVFLRDNRHAHLAGNRMNAVMLGLFDLKIHKQKGLVAMRVA